MEADDVGRALTLLAAHLHHDFPNDPDLVLLGIKTRGIYLAERLARQLASAHGQKVAMGVLDITLYRDDLTTVASSPVLKRTEILFPVETKTIVLCDDVLYTGRTVRAAIDAILDFGRPRRILLAVLVDRGRRELPIEAQLVGKKISTSATEVVSVTFKETDGEDDVWLLDRHAEPASARRGAAPKGTRKTPAKKAPARAGKPARKAAPKARPRGKR